ncbi:MAG TPA: carboxypeptidase-like regulatory domain-containing protein [Bryobacteraceae bacterium]|nr:carboxypeptidase-like regulatory domain-containing protein [Bryobacteraceae bacterium]
MSTRFLILSALAVAFAAPASPQTSNAGTVAGQVTDEQNAAIPGAEVKLTDISTNTPLTTQTNAEGRYVFPQVPPGIYNVAFTKQGFAVFQVSGQSVEIGRTLTINAVLRVGSTATTVEVSAAAGSELQTLNATVGGTLTGSSLLMLPNLGRDVTSMAVLQPATTPSGQTAGSTGDLNTYQLDGANVTDDMGGNVITYETNYSGLGGSQGGGIPSGVIPTPIESIEEFKVSVSNQTSDFNNSSGGQIQMVTKRGSNQFHGAAYMFYYDTALGAANSWSNNHTPYTFGSVSLPYTPIISNHRDRFGAALGGPLLPKPFLGGKWYFFFNYEGLRFPNTLNFSAAVPSLLMRAGVIQVPNSAGQYVAYNLNPAPVTVNGVTYQPAVCPAGLCDPRGIGVNPIVSQMWSKEVPLPNSPQAAGDQYNTQGFLASIRAPQTSNTYVGRIDHDFSDKWHWYLTYRDFKLVNLTTNQVDIGGVFHGDTFGTPAAIAPRPQQPSVWTTGMTTTISASVTNSFVFSYLRNFWQWADASGPPQLPGLGGALNLGGESTSTTPGLIPYTVNSQAIRQRFWDGQDKQIRDDLTMLKGNHLIGIGGAYQRNFDYHSRSDNGAGVNNSITYESANAGFNWTTPSIQYIPTTVPSSAYSTYETLYAEVTGMLSATQLMYTRKGQQLNLQPVGSNATDRDIIPYYSVYFNDAWHVKPSFTFTYGVGWNLEMPPYELNGSQVLLVDSNDQPIDALSFVAQREKAALNGSSYTPTIGYNLIRNIGSGPKYPYTPYYGEFSPRASFAWNPHSSAGLLGKVFGNGKTVLRGGYARIFGRLNGVNLVLVPLLGPGLLQGVVCQNPLSNGTCAGSGVATPATAFRIGTDGMSAPLPAATPTLPQPFYPGINGNPETIDPYGLDPKNMRPDRTDNFTFTLQRELNSHVQLEVGYIGKILRNEFMEINLDSVPYMTTLGGQQFAAAYAQLYQQMFFNGVSPANVTAQPFFEAALGGPGSGFCKGFASCTQAVAMKYSSVIKATGVSELWNGLNAQPGWVLGRTMFSQPAPGGTLPQVTAAGLVGSYGWGNYNSLFVTLRTRDWHGLTAISNFTWGRALGTATNVQATSSTAPLSAFDLGANYGPQGFDYKYLYNLSISYAEPFFRGQRGILGHVLGGWSLAPLFTAQGGGPISVGYSDNAGGTYEAFGSVGTPGTSLFSTNAQHAVGFMPYTGGTTALYGVFGDSGSNIVYGTQAIGEKVNGSYGALGLNMFSDPGKVWGEFRPCVLGYDASCGGGSNMRGLPTWNLDANLIKDITFRERAGVMLFITITNVLNHFQPSNPSFSLTSPTTFGQITGQSNTPRNMEFGVRIHF